MQNRVNEESIHYIIFFDGYCNLCNVFINYCIDHDPMNKFYFSNLHSQKALELIPKHITELYRMNPLEGTVVLWQNGETYLRSEAAFRIFAELDSRIRLMSVFRLLPKFFTDGIYKWISKNRYKMFGKSNNCKIPTEEMKLRFLN